jgi:hypothetical protein
VQIPQEIPPPRPVPVNRLSGQPGSGFPGAGVAPQAAQVPQAPVLGDVPQAAQPNITAPAASAAAIAPPAAPDVVASASLSRLGALLVAPTPVAKQPDAPETVDSLKLVLPDYRRIQVRPGDSVSQIATNTYGQASATMLDLMKMANPSIRDIDIISVGQSCCRLIKASRCCRSRTDSTRYRCRLRIVPARSGARCASTVRGARRRANSAAAVRCGAC